MRVALAELSEVDIVIVQPAIGVLEVSKILPARGTVTVAPALPTCKKLDENNVRAATKRQMYFLIIFNEIRSVALIIDIGSVLLMRTGVSFDLYE